MASCYRSYCSCHPSDVICLVDGHFIKFSYLQEDKVQVEDVEKARGKTMKQQPEFIMLVGLPLSGKTIFRRQMMSPFDNNLIIISSDDYIEALCNVHCVSYNYGFPIFIDAAQKACTAAAKHWASTGANILWDQTNLTEASRKAKLSIVDNDKSNWKYKKTCYYFTPPDHEILMKRQKNSDRVGKTIPEKVLIDMRSKVQIPGLCEGFDRIAHVSGISGGITFDSENKSHNHRSMDDDGKLRIRQALNTLIEEVDGYIGIK